MQKSKQTHVTLSVHELETIWQPTHHVMLINMPIRLLVSMFVCLLYTVLTNLAHLFLLKW